MKNIRILTSGLLLLLALIFHLTGIPGTWKDIALIVTTVLAGFPIAIKALKTTRMRMFSIELLVTIAVTGALIIGEYMEAGVVSFLFLFGGYLEAKTLARARASLRSLMEKSPSKATILRDGKTYEIAADEVRKKDVVIIKSGGKIPVDGPILSGHGEIIEASITGESVPVEKGKGDEVFSGSILDHGYLEVSAERVGEDTTFAHILDMVEEAQESKAKTQKFLEQFATYYTPAILLLSLIVGLITFDVHLTLTFLVIACPGALVISAPVSLVAGIGNGAANGILIKGGEKIEQLAKVNGMVFDKTGTLTRGTPEVTDVIAIGMSEKELLKLAMEVELNSEHHLGRAITREARKWGLLPEYQAKEVQILKGLGITAKVENRSVYIGNQRGWNNLGLPPLSSENNKYLSCQEEKGNTVVLMSVDRKLAGIISIADQIREEARTALTHLRQNGVKHTVMLTGDNYRAAAEVGKILGITTIHAQLLPEDKVEKIKMCKKKGVTLAMVGDGINDAPAIATADVGIAMGGTGTHLALETADVILMSDRLDKLNYAYELAKATVRNMKQNMYFSVFVVLLLLAGVLTGHIFLASGMLIHEASVLIVILNALRLVRFPKGILYQLHETILWWRKPEKQDVPIHPKKDYREEILDVALVKVC